MSADWASVVAPGAGGSPEQPIVRAMLARLASAGVDAVPVAFTGGGRSTQEFAAELEALRTARAELQRRGARRIVLIGRSFGGRMCTRLAALETPAALVVLGHPISPAGRPRPDDEAALEEVQCPTLIVQGSKDHLGPLEVLQRIAAAHPSIELSVLDGVGHNFGRHTTEAVERAATWLSATLGA